MRSGQQQLRHAVLKYRCPRGRPFGAIRVYGRTYVQRERERAKQFRRVLARLITIAGVECWDFDDDERELLMRELRKARRHGYDPEIEDAMTLLQVDVPDSWREKV